MPEKDKTPKKHYYFHKADTFVEGDFASDEAAADWAGKAGDVLYVVAASGSRRVWTKEEEEKEEPEPS